MAVLSDSARFEIWAESMQEYSRNGETIPINKADLRAAVNAIDTWLNDNAASANAAIPIPARSALTTPQKALLTTLVIQRRYLDGA